MSKVSVHKLTKEMMGNTDNLLTKVRITKGRSQKQIVSLQLMEKQIQERLEQQRDTAPEIPIQEVVLVEDTQKPQNENVLVEKQSPVEKPVANEKSPAKPDDKTTHVAKKEKVKVVANEKPIDENEKAAKKQVVVKDTTSDKAISSESKKTDEKNSITKPKSSGPKKIEKKPAPAPTIGIRVVKQAPTEEERRQEDEKRRAEREKFRQRNKERQLAARRDVRGRAPQGNQGGRPMRPRPEGQPQGGYRQGGQSQGGYRQGGQSQGGYRQDGQSQGGYRPGGQSQGGYRQGGQSQGNRPPYRSNNAAGGSGGYNKDRNNTSRPSNNRPGGGARSKDKELLSTVKPQKPNAKDYTRKTTAKSKDNNRNDQNKPKVADKSNKFASNRLVYGDVYIPTGSRHKKRRKSYPKQNIERIVIENAVITTENVSVKILAEKIGKPGADIIKQLMILGIFANINQFIDFETAELVASEFDITLEHKVAKSQEELMMDIHEESHDDDDNFKLRAPIVTVMGHVDHGKTSLLDAIRNTNVLDTEAGGITQHIGAYAIEHNGAPITFIDTPGHEAFTAMRARGAQVTDIAILVVAADDGVMPQTIEAINHAKAAGVPVIVAINKIDLPAASPSRVMQELTEHEIVAEEWGGETIMAPVSAMTGEGLENLLEMISIQAEILELRANPDGRAVGTIIESRLEIGRGPVATVLIKNGTLHIGDSVVAGLASGRVRAMNNDKGERITQAGPSMPVEVIGFSEVPGAGDEIYAADDKISKKVAQERKTQIREDMTQASKAMSLDELFGKIAQGQVKDLNIIVKADVQGSAEAVKQSLEKLTNDEVRVRCISTGVGAITESDVMLATASNAIIIGFNVRPDSNGRVSSERENVEIRTYRIIYNAIEDIEKAMIGMLDPEFKEVVIGHAQVRNVFKVTGVGFIAGSYVTDGNIKRSATARILRDSVIIFEGNISSLKRFKDDVREVAANYECGIGVENYNDIKENDVIEVFETIEIER